MNQKLNSSKLDEIIVKAGKLRKNYIKTNKYVKRMLDSLIDMGHVHIDLEKENYSADKIFLKNANYLIALVTYFSELYLGDFEIKKKEGISLYFKYTVLENCPNYFRINITKENILSFESLKSKPNEYWVVI